MFTGVFISDILGKVIYKFVIIFNAIVEAADGLIKNIDKDLDSLNIGHLRRRGTMT